MLEIRNISKSYTTGDFTQKALDQVSVTFRDNEFVAVLGPSGSGKTTLLNVIGGLDHYDSGDLLVDGRSTAKFKDRDWDHYRNNQVGFIFQNYNLIPHQSVLSNVELALSLSGISKSERKNRAIKALSEVGLQDHIHKKPNQLSGGQQQRVAIARAIVNNPSIIFADEPTGALDTKTSIQIMEILKKISKNKLVVMVTHNPELADEYATRIVNLQDAKIIHDSDPLDLLSSKSKKQKKFKKGKTAMSFATALSLSFSNLMGKKGRTFMTAFAGSIGIIGISAILALSNGTSEYIANVEKNTLSQYPLQITKSKSIFGELMDDDQGGIAATIKNMTENNHENGKVGVRDFLTKILSTSGSNDLKSLKAYLDSNPDNINSRIDSTEYSYNVKPIFYSQDDYKQEEVYPNDKLTSLYGGGSSAGGGSSMSFSGGSSGFGSTMGTMNSFVQMPKNKDLYMDKYSVVAGRWNTNKNEAVLVLHQDGTINDSLVYTLGLRDRQELDDAIDNFTYDKKVNLPNDYGEVDMNQIIGKKFKIVHAADLYKYQADTGLWVDKRKDENFVKGVLDTSQDLEIVGIIRAPEGNKTALSLSAGINYLPELSLDTINYASQTQIVADQNSKPEIDVLTGEAFADEKNNNSLNSDVMSSIFTIDQSAMSKLFSFDMPSFQPNFNMDNLDIESVIKQTLTEDKLNQIISTIFSSKDLSKDLQKDLVLAVNSYINRAPEYSSMTPEVYFSEGNPGYLLIYQMLMDLGKDISEPAISQFKGLVVDMLNNIKIVFENAVTQSVSSMMSNLSNLGTNFTFNESALADVFKIDFSGDKLMQIASLFSGNTTRTFDTNMMSFGYADVDFPSQIVIYPKDFYAKDEICACIDNYNQQKIDSNEPDKAISYTDYAKLLMNSVTTMIDMITAVLVAFVGISLVVSSIMIGIITYVSVLERRKEIGILRAIGARKLDIFNVFNAETFIVGLIAGFIGIVFTAIGCFPANAIAKLMFDVEYDIAILPLWAAIVLILISVFLTFVAGLIPSTSASKKDPVEAINS